MLSSLIWDRVWQWMSAQLGKTDMTTENTHGHGLQAWTWASKQGHGACLPLFDVKYCKLLVDMHIYSSHGHGHRTWADKQGPWSSTFDVKYCKLLVDSPCTWLKISLILG